MPTCVTYYMQNTCISTDNALHTGLSPICRMQLVNNSLLMLHVHCTCMCFFLHVHCICNILQLLYGKYCTCVCASKSLLVINSVASTTYSMVHWILLCKCLYNVNHYCMSIFIRHQTSHAHSLLSLKTVIQGMLSCLSPP